MRDMGGIAVNHDVEGRCVCDVRRGDRRDLIGDKRQERKETVNNSTGDISRRWRTCPCVYVRASALNPEDKMEKRKST